jgi:hypothetical protein
LKEVDFLGILLGWIEGGFLARGAFWCGWRKENVGVLVGYKQSTIDTELVDPDISEA